MKLLQLASIVFLTAVSVRAQTPNHAKGVAEPSSKPSLTIEAARAASQADLDRVARELEVESNKGNGFDPCRIKILELEQKYATWFKDRYQEFNQIENQIDQALASVKGKVAELKSNDIQAIAVLGQKTSAVGIGFNTIVSYLRNYNARIKSCSKEKLDLLKEMQEKPERNPLHIAHSQVVNAMEKMTTNLNASLKQNNSRYQIGFAEAACGYDLVLTVELTLSGGMRKQFRVSLLDGDPSLNKAAKWSMVYGDSERIGDYSASGNVRFLEMYHETIGPECALANWSKISPGELQSTLVPYVSFQKVNNEVNEAIKRGNLNGIGASTRQAQIQKRLKLELRPDDANCKSHPEQYGVVTFAPYLDGKQIATGCVYGVQLVEFSGDIFIFGIGADHNVFMHSASAPISTPWTRITSEGTIVSLIDSGVYDKRPYFVVLTSKAETYAVDAGGAKIADQSLVPSYHLGNTPTRRLSLDAPGQCDSKDGHGSLKLDGKPIPVSGCVRQYAAIPYFNDFFIFGIGGNALFYRTLYNKWAQLGGISDVAKITGVSVSRNGRPQVSYTTNQAQAQTVEVH